MVSRWMSTTPLGCLKGMNVGMPLTCWGGMYKGVWLHLKVTWQQELQVILRAARKCSRAKELFGVLIMGTTRFWSSRGILNITSPIIATPFFSWSWMLSRRWFPNISHILDLTQRARARQNDRISKFILIFNCSRLTATRLSLLLKDNCSTKYIPSRELTYPPKMAFWRWFSFSQGGIC